MIELTKARALELLEGIVNDVGPDYTYESLTDYHPIHCQYAGERQDGSLFPRCIIGKLAERLDPTGQLLWDLHTRHDAETDTVNNVNWAELNVKAEPGVTLLLAEAQKHQDSGATWADALEAARRLGLT